MRIFRTPLRNSSWSVTPYGSVTLDLDILFYEDVISNDPKLLIPHRDMQNRRFVLEPLNELCPCYVNQLLQKTVYEMLKELPD